MDENDLEADAMTEIDSPQDEAEVIQMALKALSEAQARARLLGVQLPLLKTMNLSGSPDLNGLS